MSSPEKHEENEKEGQEKERNRTRVGDWAVDFGGKAVFSPICMLLRQPLMPGGARLHGRKEDT